MTLWLTIIIILGAALLAVTAYMEWVGVMSVFTTRPARHCSECESVLKLPTAQPGTLCWRCRHQRLEHLRNLGHDVHA